MIISTKGKTTMDVVVAVMTKKKKTDLCPLCWPELEATSKFWDSMPGKGNHSTTLLCVMVCPLRMPSIPNGWSGISGASLRNSSEPMSVFLWGICASLVMRVLKPSLMECHVKDWVDNMYSQGIDYFFFFSLLRDRSLAMLTKFFPLLTTYLTSVDIGEGIPLLLRGKICLPLT